MVDKVPGADVRGLRLREVSQADLAIFYEQQLDPIANRMVAFSVKDPADRQAFDARWQKILADPDIIVRSILFDDQLVGNVSCFEMFGEMSVGYWLGKAYWGQGLATAALAAFLKVVNIRPLYARVAKDNIGSIRVLQKNNFTIIGEDKGFANARGEETEETILQLDR